MPVSMRNKIIAIAAHEVRHRMQYRFPHLRQFNAWTRHRAPDAFFRVITKYVYLLHVAERRICRKEGESERCIRSKTNPLEFDAKVIETAFIHRLDKLEDPADMIELMYAQALPRP